MSQVDVTQYYDDLAHSYDQNRFGNSYGQYLDSIEKAFLKQKLNRNGQTVDFACGTGRLTQFAEIGIDVSEKMLEVARTKYPDKTFLLSDGSKIPLEDASVGAVISFHLFMHLDKTQFKTLMAEIHRVLIPGGQLIFDVPNAWRRKKIGYQKEGWHGNTSYTVEEIYDGMKPLYTDPFYIGILILPAHRFPKFMRSSLSKIDRILANTFLKKYASYFFFGMKKND